MSEIKNKIIKEIIYSKQLEFFHSLLYILYNNHKMQKYKPSNNSCS